MGCHLWGRTESDPTEATQQQQQQGFSGGSSGKESACNVGDARDMGLIPGLGSSPGVGNGNPSSILAWRIPWTEEPGGLQTMG